MWAVEGAEKQQGMGTMVGDDILFGDISNLSDLIPCSPSSSESLFDFRLFRWRWFVIFLIRCFLSLQCALDISRMSEEGVLWRLVLEGVLCSTARFPT